MAHRGHVAGHGAAAVLAGHVATFYRSAFVDSPRAGSPGRFLPPRTTRSANDCAARCLEEIPAVAAGPATVERNAPTTIYTQVLHHPRLQWATRRLELWNREPRARLTLRFYRISCEAPEWFFVAFSLPCEGVLPRTSNGGLPFVPYQDQLPGSCRDYFAIDGWVHYETPQGNWLWVSRDAPLVTFGGQQVLARRKDAPQKPTASWP